MAKGIDSISSDPRILLLFGPTASGKTAAGVQLAQHLGGEVINADSMQVYAGLPLLTAIPDMAEREGVPHHLFGSVEPETRFSVGKWAQAAMDLIHEIRGRGRVPILLGGTGLYFEALTNGLAEMPDIPDTRLQALRAELEQDGLPSLLTRLHKLDPDSAYRLMPNDTQRIVRALSVVEETGTPLSHWQADTKALLSPDAWHGVVLMPDRETLYARINARFAQMINAGALDELCLFLAQHGNDGLSLHKAVGVPPLVRHVHGEIPLDEAMEQAKRDTRRYAKRQMTWARGRMADWPVFASSDELMATITS